MEIILTADWHAQGGATGRVVAQAIWDCFEYADRRDADMVIIPGDLHEDAALALGREASCGDVQASVMRPMMRFLQGRPERRIIAMPGNHDLLRVSSLSALEYLKGIPGVIVVEEPRIITVTIRGETVIVPCMPWIYNTHLRALPEYRDMPDAEFVDVAIAKRQTLLHGWRAALAGDRSFKILAGHAEITGARNRYRELADGETHVFSLRDLQDVGCDALAFGHYHLAQMDAYIGALVQLNHGEEDNPTGWDVLNTTNGTREHVETDCPRYYTARTWETYEALHFRAGRDVVKLELPEHPKDARGVDLELPSGVRFVRELKPKELRARAREVTADAPTAELLRVWLTSRHGEHPTDEQREAATAEADRLAPALARVATAAPFESKRPMPMGALERIREIRLENVGSHHKTHMRIQSDGLLAVIGDTGVGKSMLVETPALVWFGEMPSNPGGMHLKAPEGFLGDQYAEVVFDVDGITYRASRRVRHTTAGAGEQKCQLEMLDMGDVTGAVWKALAGPKVRAFEAALEPLIGEKDTFLATVFQSQTNDGSIVDMDPSERMAHMRRWLGCDRFEAAAKHCGDEVARVQGEMDACVRKIKEAGEPGIRLELARENREGLEALRDENERAQRGIEKGIAEAQEQRTRLLAQSEAFDDLLVQHKRAGDAVAETRREVDRNNARIGDATRQLEEEPALRARLAERNALEEQRKTLADERAAADAKKASLATLEAEQRDLVNRINAAIAGERATIAAKVRELDSRIGRLRAEIRNAENDAIATVTAARRLLDDDMGRVQNRINAAVQEAKTKRDRERSNLSNLYDRAAYELQAEKERLEFAITAAQKEVASQEKRLRLLDDAGCKANPLPCAFIRDVDGVHGPGGTLETARAKLAELDATLAGDTYKPTARTTMADASQKLEALAGDVDPLTINPEARAELAQLAEKRAAVMDPDLLALVPQLRDEVARDEKDHHFAREALAASQQPGWGDALTVDLRAELQAKRAAADDVRKTLPNLGELTQKQRDTDARIEELHQVERRLGTLEQVRSSLATYTEDTKRLRDVMADRERVVAELAAKIQEGRDSGFHEALQHASARLGELGRTAEGLRQGANNIARQLGDIDAQIRTLAETIDAVAAAEAELAAARETQGDMRTLADFLGKNGAPQILIDLAIPHLNAILAEMTADMDPPLLIEFDTQKALQKGGTKEGLWIFVSDHLSPHGRDIRQRSGGQKGFQQTLIRQAKGIFGAQRAGRSNRVFVLDEPSIGMSPEYVSRVLTLIYRLTSRFNQVWSVSHDPGLLHSIPTVYRLEWRDVPGVGERAHLIHPEGIGGDAHAASNVSADEGGGIQIGSSLHVTTGANAAPPEDDVLEPMLF
jgi:DNA repair exonuclease SbcCD ATPase subunit/DNA repair exonuclease SbcCD nuclease subunit